MYNNESHHGTRDRHQEDPDAEPTSDDEMLAYQKQQ
jgi:hypothetical protein